MVYWQRQPDKYTATHAGGFQVVSVLDVYLDNRICAVPVGRKTGWRLVKRAFQVTYCIRFYYERQDVRKFPEKNA